MICGFDYNCILKTNAKILAVACISCTCKSSFKSKVITLGARFKPDQNGLPVYSMIWFYGNAYSNWAIWLWNTSQNILTAIYTHFEYDFDSFASYIRLRVYNFDLATDGFCLFYFRIESKKNCLFS